MRSPVNDISSIQFVIMSECTHIVHCVDDGGLCFLSLSLTRRIRSFICLFSAVCVRMVGAVIFVRSPMMTSVHRTFSIAHHHHNVHMLKLESLCHLVCAIFYSMINWNELINPHGLHLPGAINPMIINWKSSSFRKLILAGWNIVKRVRGFSLLVMQMSANECKCRRYCKLTHSKTVMFVWQDSLERLIRFGSLL